jgi:poly-gamma-glutamate capsule biosynthesis protein CapA/YwtB (metallophosphatase superfamily)
MRRGAAGTFAGAIAVAMVAACTGGDGKGSAGTGPGTDPVTSASSDPSGVTTDPPPTTADPGSTDRAQPLVIISNPRRPRLELTLAEAQALADGHVGAALDTIRQQTGGRVYLYRSSVRPVANVARGRSTVAVVPVDKVGPTVQTALVDGIDPLLRPQAYPLRLEDSRESAPVVTTLTFVGDIMLGRGVAAANPLGAGRTLAPYAPRLRSADIAVGNLESTLSTDGRPRQGDDSFAASPSVVRDLERAGLDLLTLANNHTGDYGPRALRQTLDRIDHGGVARVGAGRNAAEAWSPVVLRRNGLSFGFLAFNAIGETPRATRRSPGAAELRMQPRLGPLNDADLARMTRSVHRLAADVDVVTVLPHWGDQYTHLAVRDQRKVARALVDAGADLVVGGHPHWVQGVAVRERAFVAYSLGNFVFDMDFYRQTMEGIALNVVFWGDRLMAATPEPYVLDARFAPRPADDARGLAVLDDVWRSSFGVLKGRELRPSLP